MAKKDKKKSKKKDNPGADAVGAVRTAVERTFQATADSAQTTRTRAQDLVDEVAGAASRVREMIEQVGVLEDLKGLRREVEHLARRVAALEGGNGAQSRSTSSRPKSSGAAKRRAKPSGSAKRSGGTTRKPAAKRSSRSTASKSSGAGSKPRSSGSTRKRASSRKPAAKRS